MIKLITSELLFDDCPKRPSGIGHKEVFINEKLVESIRIVEHTVYTFKDEYFYTPQGSYNIAEGSSVVFLKELTMSSGEKFLTMDKLDCIGEFEELR